MNKPILILAGGGHAQLSVLRLIAAQQPYCETVLITPQRHQMYSGMLPGWMAGHYTLDECRIDLLPLAKEAGVRVIQSRVERIDAAHQHLQLANGDKLNYDYLSLDVGSEINTVRLQAAGALLLPVKPLENFVAQWPLILHAAAQKSDYRLVVVGGGAAGIELTFAAHHAFAQRGLSVQIALVVSQNGLLPGHSEGVKRRAIALLKRKGIALHQSAAVGDAAGVLLSTGERLCADCVLAATGARPAAWLAQTDLARDEQGYVLVDAQHRSISHPSVFAAGDVAMRSDVLLPRAGVHAVFAGPVVAHNLLSVMQDIPLQRYRPRKKSLYLLATGSKHAIASWGKFSAQGAWVWHWKNWIDQRFMNKYRRFAREIT